MRAVRCPTGSVRSDRLKAVRCGLLSFADFSHRGLEHSLSPRRLNPRCIDLPHLHHRVERALAGCVLLTCEGHGQGARGDLPRRAPSVLAPTAGAGIATVVDDGNPLAVGLACWSVVIWNETTMPSSQRLMCSRRVCDLLRTVGRDRPTESVSRRCGVGRLCLGMGTRTAHLMHTLD
jgi:hypothetical protein